MPIRESEKARYPTDWRIVSVLIRERARGRCEGGSPAFPECRAYAGEEHPETGSIVVLTVAHLNHQPEDCRPENLRAWVPAMPPGLRRQAPRGERARAPFRGNEHARPV